jgi:hypothetical protein
MSPTPSLPSTGRPAISSTVTPGARANQSRNGKTSDGSDTVNRTPGSTRSPEMARSPSISDEHHLNLRGEYRVGIFHSPHVAYLPMNALIAMPSTAVLYKKDSTECQSTEWRITRRRTSTSEVAKVVPTV